MKTRFHASIPVALRLGLFIAIGFCLALPTAYAQISVVVGSSSSLNATEAQVKDFFSGAKVNWSDGTKVQVVDQPNSPLSELFYQALIGRSPAQVRVQWTKLVLSGQATAPVKGANDDEVKKTVSSTDGAIGFIATSALDGTVKELIRLEN